MKALSPSGATRVLTLAALGCVISQFLAGSVALSQPFPSFILDTTRVKGPSLNNAVGTRVAVGNDNICLTVWVEGVALFGARVNAASALLDSVPIDITGTESRSSNRSPQVVWSGSDFMVVWTDNWRVLLALVTPDGQVTQRTTLQDSTMMGAAPALGFDGDNFLACWTAWNADSLYRAQFVRVTPDGVVLDSAPRLVARGNPNRQYSVAVHFSGDRYLAVWTNYDSPGGLWGTFILPDGTVTDSVGFPIRSGVSAFEQPAATHDARNFVVSWTESGSKLKLGRVTDGGLVLDTAGVLIDSFATGGGDLTSSGDTTLVVFGRDSSFNGDSTEVVARRVNVELQPVDSTPLVLMPARQGDYNEPDPSVAFAGWGYVTAWCNPFLVGKVAYNTNPVLLRLDLQGHAVDTAAIVLSLGTNGHSYPDVASDGTNFLGVWIDTRHDSIQRSEAVCGMRFSQDGTRLDPAGFRISPPGAARPALAFGAGCYLVCWTHEGDVYGARVLPDGRLEDSVPIAIEHGSPNAYNPDVAFGDSMFLVVWRAGNMAYGTRVRPDGVVADTGPKAMQPHYLRSAKYPQVGFDGHNFLVIRNEHGNWFYAARVSTAGELLDTTDIVLGRPASSLSIPKVAFGDSVYMVVDSRRARSWGDSPHGEVLDSLSPSYFDYAQVVFDGTNFMLLCERDSNNELGGMRITPDGQVLDSTPFLLVTTQSASASVRYAAMAANSSGRIGLVSQCYEPLPYLAGRIRAAAFPAIGIGSERENGQPARFRVLPNPASRMVSLSFGLRQAGPVQVSAFDAAGRRCAVVHSGMMTAGAHSLPFDTRRLANGVYFLRFEAGADTRSARMVVSH